MTALLVVTSNARTHLWTSPVTSRPSRSTAIARTGRSWRPISSTGPFRGFGPTSAPRPSAPPSTIRPSGAGYAAFRGQARRDFRPHRPSAATPRTRVRCKPFRVRIPAPPPSSRFGSPAPPWGSRGSSRVVLGLPTPVCAPGGAARGQVSARRRASTAMSSSGARLPIKWCMTV